MMEKERGKIVKRTWHIISGAMVLILIGILIAVFSGFFKTHLYNKQIIDMNYQFNRAIIDEFDKVADVKVKSWNDYEDSDMIQVVGEDGHVYYTHSKNVILIR